MKKLFLIFAVLTAVILPVFAFPGFESYLPDTSGEYVFYKDSSFTRESYIGILIYNEESLQIKYFAPQDDKNNLPEKEIAILVSFDKNADYFEMTGERILSTILPDTDDTEIVNYLHDILYDFSARRAKETDVNPENSAYKTDKTFKENGLKSIQNYDQFGGNVTITFDCLIPIFNIKSITGSDGKNVIECCQIGRLESSTDPSFDSFFPITFKPSDVKINSVPVEKAKSKVCSYENQSITLDENWSSPADTIWMLNDEAVINLNIINPPLPNELQNKLYIQRLLLESSGFSFIDLNTCEFISKPKQNQYKLTTYTYLGNTEKVYIGIKVLTTNPKTNETYLMSFSSKNDVYTGKRSYFDKILKSYSIKN